MGKERGVWGRCRQKSRRGGDGRAELSLIWLFYSVLILLCLIKADWGEVGRGKRRRRTGKGMRGEGRDKFPKALASRTRVAWWCPEGNVSHWVSQSVSQWGSEAVRQSMSERAKRWLIEMLRIYKDMLCNTTKCHYITSLLNVLCSNTYYYAASKSLAN